MALLGESYVAAGRVTEGMTLLDQAMAAVATGEVIGVGAAGEIFSSAGAALATGFNLTVAC